MLLGLDAIPRPCYPICTILTDMIYQCPRCANNLLLYDVSQTVSRLIWILNSFFLPVRNIRKLIEDPVLLLQLILQTMYQNYYTVVNSGQIIIQHWRRMSKISDRVQRLTHTLLPRTLSCLAHFADSYFASKNILLLNTFWSLEKFDSWNTLLPSKFCFLEHFAPWNTLLLGTLCFLKHFASQHILLPSTFCFLEHFTPWNTLLHGTFYSFVKCSPQHTMLSRT